MSQVFLKFKYNIQFVLRLSLVFRGIPCSLWAGNLNSEHTLCHVDPYGIQYRPIKLRKKKTTVGLDLRF